MTRYRLRPAPFLSFLAIGFSMSVAACAAPGQTSAGASMVLTEADAGSIARRVAVGATIVLRLPTQPGTGYSWAVASDPTVEQPTPPASIGGSGIPGGIETRVFTFRFKSPGLHKVRLSYSQPWSGGQKDAKVLTYTFDAR